MKLARMLVGNWHVLSFSCLILSIGDGEIDDINFSRLTLSTGDVEEQWSRFLVRISARVS